MSVALEDGRLTDLPAEAYIVTFSPQFTNRLCESVHEEAVRSPAPVAGLLFGRSEFGRSHIQSFESVSAVALGARLSADLVATFLASCRTGSEAATLDLIGWYALRQGGGVDKEDLEFHNRYFAQANGIALILRPEQHPHFLLEIYGRSGSTPLSQHDHLSGSLRLIAGSSITEAITVPLTSKLNDDAYLRAYQISQALDRAQSPESWLKASAKRILHSPFRQRREEPDDQHSLSSPPPARAAAAAASASTESSAIIRLAQPSKTTWPPPAAVRPAPSPAKNSAARMVLSAVFKPRRLAIRWISPILIAPLAAIATFSYLFRADIVPKAPASGALPPTSPNRGLGLRAEGQGDRVLLTWNRTNAAVRSSETGILHIDDGDQHRDISLDTIQIRNGSVLYHPGSDDVSFRLEVRGQDGAATVDSMRVLEGAKTVVSQATNAPSDFATLLAVNNAPAVGPSPSPAEPAQRESPRQTKVTVPVSKPVPQARAILRHPSPDRPKTGLEAQRVLAEPVPPPPAAATVPPLAISSESRLIQTPPHIATLLQTTTAVPNPSPTGGSLQKVSAAAQAPITAGILAPAPVSKPAPQDLTQNFVRPRPIRQVHLDFKVLGSAFTSSMASRVSVIVKVNTDGRVTEAHLVSKIGITPQLAFVSLSAAKQWMFTPATLDGKKVTSFHTIEFDIHPSGS